MKKKIIFNKRNWFILLFLCVLFIPIYYFYNKEKDAEDTGGIQAKWADDLVDSIGVNTHLFWPSYNFQVKDTIKDHTKPAITIKCTDAACTSFSSDLTNLYVTDRTGQNITNPDPSGHSIYALGISGYLTTHLR